MPMVTRLRKKGVGGGKEEPSTMTLMSSARTDGKPPGRRTPRLKTPVALKKRFVSENVVNKSQTIVRKETSLATPVPDGGNIDTKKKPRTKFPERLLWKTQNLRMPTTSTPKREPRSKKVTKYDIDTAFGFDDSTETTADYSTLLSPIAHASPKGIIPHPVWKVHPLSQRNVECGAGAPDTFPRQLEVPGRLNDDAVRCTKKRVHDTEERDPGLVNPNPKPALKQYGRASIIETKSKITKKAQKPKKKGVDKHCEKDLSEEARRWLEEKNKEFEEVLQRNGECGAGVPNTLAKPPELPHRLKDAAIRSTRKRVHNTKETDPEMEYEVNPNPKPALKQYGRASTIETKSKITKKAPKSKKKDADKDFEKDFGKEARRCLEEKNKGFQEVLQCNVECGAGASDSLPKPPKLSHRLKDTAVRCTRKKVHYTEERDPETEYDFIPRSKPPLKQYGRASIIETKSKITKKTQKPKKKDVDKDCEEDWGEEARRWLEERNKEFEEVLKTRLVIEHSHSD